MKHIKRQSCHICLIFTPKRMIWQKETMCAYTHSYHALPHCKCVLRCCSKCPSVDLSDQEIADHYPDTSPSIRSHIYHIIARCITHGRLLLTEKKICCKCKQDTAS